MAQTRMSLNVEFLGWEVGVYPRDIVDNLPEDTGPGETEEIEAAIRDYVHAELTREGFPSYATQGVGEILEAVQSLLEERNNED